MQTNNKFSENAQNAVADFNNSPRSKERTIEIQCNEEDIMKATNCRQLDMGMQHDSNMQSQVDTDYRSNSPRH